MRKFNPGTFSLAIIALAAFVSAATYTFDARADRIVYDDNGRPMVVREQCAVNTVPYYNGYRYQPVASRYVYGWNNNTAAIQSQLIQLGYWVGNEGASGVMNGHTRTAIKQFQREHGLKVDGVVGYQTSSALNGRVSGARYAQGGWVNYPTYTTARYYR
jgi:hypothetical protein